ncbi:hypothetical protein ACZ90_67460 [Streptomyces albus subsp. albus]|nr:hypothetical protein ACZ90_67460 [Streptomyces albus subsp. albus]
MLVERLVSRRTPAWPSGRPGGAIEPVNGRPTAEGAVAIVHQPDTGKVLPHKRDPAARYWAGYWSLPGGGIELGEFPDETILR